ncbi:MAG: uroporphyrinogen-III C-methyltransferase [Planctomycetota bacterium]
MTPKRGTVYLVGAGPGDPELITVRGRHLLQKADVIACDRLIEPEQLSYIRENAEVVYVGKGPGNHTLKQEDICELLIDRARAGKSVVRLKGGDPYVFGRGYEEREACTNAGVPCVVIPGVTSAIAAPSAVGIPLTDRRFVRAFVVMTARMGHDVPHRPIDFTALAAIDTIVVMMGREALSEIAGGLMQAGRIPSTPVACVEWATTPRQRCVTGSLETIDENVRKIGLEAPMVTVVGEVAQFAQADQSAPSPTNRPLFGKKIVVTRPLAASRSLCARLHSAGATAISCPTIRIAPPHQTDELDAAIHHLHEFDWVIFTSQNTVRFFWKRLTALNLDARILAGCKVAAVGTSTARALSKNGIRADIVPPDFTGKSLSEAISVTSTGIRNRRILYPKSNLTLETLGRSLREKGARVTEVVAYQTIPARPSATLCRTIQDGVDAVLFFSPSAVTGFVEAELDIGNAVVGCVGPTTAVAARKTGLNVSIIAQPHSAAGLYQALIQQFNRLGAKT